MPQFDAKSCVLCSALSSRRGEHVDSRWFRDGFAGQGPFTIEKNGTSYKNRDGNAVTEVDLPGVYVPMCPTHNHFLNSTVEVPCKPAYRKLVAGVGTGTLPALTAVESRDLAVWLTKVTVLRGHPDAEHSTPAVDRDMAPSRLSRMEDCWIDWLRRDPAIPDGFSVYIYRRGFTTSSPLVGKPQRVLLPRVVVGTDDLHYRVFNAFGFECIQSLVVWHPGYPLTHPLVAEGRAVQLWPNPQPVELSILPDVNPREVSFVDHGMVRMFQDGPEFEKAVAAGELIIDDPIEAFMARTADQSGR